MSSGVDPEALCGSAAAAQELRRWANEADEDLLGLAPQLRPGPAADAFDAWVDQALHTFRGIGALAAEQGYALRAVATAVGDAESTIAADVAAAVDRSEAPARWPW